MASLKEFFENESQFLIRLLRAAKRRCEAFKTHSKVIVIYADYGGAWAWDEEGVCIGSDNDAIEDFEINQGLLDKFDSWQRKFESTPFDQHGNLLNFDWEEFHREGLSLCRELKRELGDVTVIYEKAFEDPDHDKDGRVEIR